MLTSFYTAFSQENKETIYVQNIISMHAEFFANTLKKGNCIMICGSINMQKGVDRALEKITENNLNIPLEVFKENNQIQTDCY